MLGGKEGGQMIEPVEPARPQRHPLDGLDAVALPVPVPHPIADPQGLDGAFAAIGHQDAGIGDEAGLGMGLVCLPLVVVEVIAQRGGEQGQGDGRTQQQSALAGFERGQ